MTGSRLEPALRSAAGVSTTSARLIGETASGGRSPGGAAAGLPTAAGRP